MKLLAKRILFYLALTITLSIAICFTVSAGTEDSYLDISLDTAKIHSLYNTIASAGRFVEKLDSSTVFDLPVGLSSGATKDPSYSILINKAVLKPNGAYFTAYMSLKNPLDGSKLDFEARNIEFSYKGGLKGNIQLALVTETRIKICKDVVIVILPGTYVEWDCTGFKKLKIKGNVEFSNSSFLAANEKGELLKDPTTLKAYFETEVKNLNDLSFVFTLPPFQIKGVSDITFSCKNLALDYSDSTNPEAIKFPTNYLSGYPAGTETLWKGIYIGEASIILGPKFKNKNTKAPTTFSTKDLIIDENGFTGELSATNLLALNSGDLGGWNFSVSKLSVKLTANTLTEASFGGKIHIPIFKDSTNFDYAALIDLEGKYNFTVSPDRNMDFPLLGSSKLSLDKNSSITIAVENDKFVPTAILNGNLAINAPLSNGNSKNNLQLAKVEFQEMRISTVAPVFDVKYLSVTGLSQGVFATFPITIDQITFRSSETSARMTIGLAVNLMNSNDEGFSGKTKLILIANRDGFNYHFKGIEIDKIAIDVVKKGAYELHGNIEFAKDDPVYGNGFRGDLSAKFGGKIEVEAIALFGTVNSMRYFFVDALFAEKPGIPAGPLTFYGFGGGLYYHMKQKPGTVDPNSFGASRSGIVYQPNDSIKIGIMAEIKFGVITEKIMDADVKFEIVFNSSGGLNRITFTGNSKCIVPGITIVPDNLKAQVQTIAGNKKLDFNPVDAAMATSVFMQQDFENDVFHAELESFVNVGPVLKGIGPQGSAGKCVMHIEPDKWYLHIGTQTNPIGLSLLGIIKIGGYFMVGDDIPTGLPLNPTVASILNITPEKASTNRDQLRLSTGRGIAFGAGFSINTGDLTFLCFYGSFEVGAGFDILLISYPQDAYCAGHQAPLGINGWYAKGQAYAYLKGNIGISVRVFGRRKKFEILSIAAAAQLRAEGPNPVYLEGQAGGNFRVLGGLIEGSCKFKVTYGEKCDMVLPTLTSPLADLEMIAAITPQEKDKEVDVFSTPQVVFNIPVEKEFNISDYNSAIHKYKANITKLNIEKDGKPVSGSLKWNEDKSVVIFLPDNILYPKADYKLDVELSFVENISGKWEISKDENGNAITESKSSTFTTGSLPKDIPSNLIAYSYPINRQYNFYPQEYPQGYIAFTAGLAPYFNPGSQYHQVAKFTPVGNGQSLTSDLSYDASSKTVTFTFPSGLSNDHIYKMELTNVPVSTSIDKNVTEKTSSVDLQNDSSSLQVTSREASETLSDLQETTFLSYAFRTSKFKSFADKLSFSELEVNMLYDISPYVYYLQVTSNGSEMFDKYEIYGDDNTPALIRRHAVLEESTWFKKNVEPIIYKDYPLLGKATIDWRSTASDNPAPSDDIKIWQLNYDHTLTDDEITSGVATAVATWANIMYTMPYYWSKDYYDIRMKLANLYPKMEHSDPHVNAILKKVIWPVVDQGNYPVHFDYVLPGINKVTTSKTFNMKNPFHIVQPSL